ncbi:ABC transporter ATP-binding protein [Natrarchaeobius halalkaliphilus]|uniref:ABC transporter ATP-binding protein n=1 Tax=Natrarchaeobius halalkaliphilus TaxID=1679091 RepID=A0A3N6MSS0_9EURY|nr:ABC transporter ATP-binding protein [Natrarchaeobius halalkaliphilus]RQG87805.1 ABC transporter ATP-binding protein [Natrarchaeobius halalkaliphilus]
MSITTKPESDSDSQALIDVNDLSKLYETNQSIISRLFGEKEYLRAVDNVSFEIQQGEIVGLAGQSGCGKSTLGELLVQLQEPSSGEIIIDGDDITEYSSSELKTFRRKCQVIFQDPYEAINPRFTVSRIVSEPLKIHSIGDRQERTERTIKALNDAGLSPAEEYLGSFPRELSGGERQRVNIARAIVLEPDFLIADEPVSMLDVSVRTGILKLFEKFKEEMEMSILYVSHDLSTINYLCDRTMIMYLGKVVEVGKTRNVIHYPSHPYTKTLLQSVPDTQKQTDITEESVQGEVPDPIDLPPGCRYASWCSYADEKCERDEPLLQQRDDGEEASDQVACHYPIENNAV